MKTIFLLLIFPFVMFSKLFSQDALDIKDVTYRPAKVAGTFYPGNAESLRAEINKYLDKAQQLTQIKEIYGIVVPHAGYVFSGWVAAKAYKPLIGRKYDAVLILAPSHYKLFKGASVFNGEAYVTPLGEAMVDTKLANEIASLGDDVNLSLNGHDWHGQRSEHSIEVQIPFIQTVLPGTKIVPVAFGQNDNRSIDSFVKAVVGAVKKLKRKILVIASTDLSHYHPYEEAKKIDRKLIRDFGRFDYFKLNYDLDSGKCEACGGSPLISAMLITELLGANAAFPAFYANSGESPFITSDKKKVVGYLAGLMIKDKFDSFNDFPKFSDNDIKILKDNALKSIESSIGKGKKEYMRFSPPSLQRIFSAFVTLRKDGRLRGCMGHTIATQPLIDEVSESGIMAATRDPRFSPVKPEELKDIHLEITVLSRFKRVYDVKDITVGEDGVYLKSGFHSGIFLPQVATEQHWNRDTFLQELGVKAGLNRKAYLDPNAELYRFRSVIIH